MKQFFSLIAIFILPYVNLKAQNYNQIIVGANNNGAIFSANIDGSNPNQITTSQSYWSFYGGVDNPNESKVYTSWYYGIYSMDYNGNNWQQLYNYPAGGLNAAVDIDINNNEIYFISTPEDKIYKMNLDGSGLSTILDTLTYGSDLVIDATNNYIYYSEYTFSSAFGIYRVNLDGTNQVTILPNADVSNFEIDFVNNKIYYAMGTGGYVCNLDGTNSTQIVDFQVFEFKVDNNSNLLYLTGEDSVKTSNLDGTNLQTIVNSTDIYFDTDPLENAHGIILVNNGNLGTNNYNESNKFTISPNPSSDFIQLSGLESSENYSIYNILGIEVKKGNVSNQEKINVRDFTSGLYFLKFDKGYSIKFIKE